MFLLMLHSSGLKFQTLRYIIVILLDFKISNKNSKEDKHQFFNIRKYEDTTIQLKVKILCYCGWQ